MILKLFIIFFLFGVFGAMFEAFFFNNNTICGDTMIHRIFDDCIPFLLIYAVGGIIIYLFNYYMKNYNIFLVALLATLFITVFECICGLLSFKINGRKTWTYGSGICKGYISLKVSAIWFVGILLILALFRHFNI